MFQKLHLADLAVPDNEIQSMAVSDPVLLSHVKSLLSDHKYKAAIAELNVALKDVRATAPATLMRLYLCGYENIKLYKNIVTLRTDIPIEDCLYSRSSNYLKYNNQQNGNGATTSSSQEPVVLNSSYFLYSGEDKLKHDNDVEGYFKQVSESLLKPLQLLREQYHKFT